MSGETGSLSDDLSHDRDAPGTRHPTDHLPPRHTRANITDEQHAEDHGELHHPTGHDRGGCGDGGVAVAKAGFESRPGVS